MQTLLRPPKNTRPAPGGGKGYVYPPMMNRWLDDFTGARFIRIYWHDYTSSAKCRVIPARRIREAMRAAAPFTITITKASLGLLPTDVTVPGVTGTGVYVLAPDWDSLRAGPAPGHMSCYARFLEEDGAPAPLCPRGILTRAVDLAAAGPAGLAFQVGFEVEFTVLERASTADDPDGPKYRGLSGADGHAWSMARALASWGAEGSFATVADEILSSLEEAGIKVLQFHAEGSPGQYEIVLPPRPPLEACDVLLHTRQVVESAAARRGFRVTLHPRPFSDAIGTGSHAHISIASASASASASGDNNNNNNNNNDNGADDPAVYERFYGGILAHFCAVLALTNPHPASYERLVDGLWAGGRWVTWGTHNKETPLRKCRGSHWEVKVVDGLANPYLALAALLHAGRAGAADLTWRDCAVDPATLTAPERAALGIDTRFPAGLAEALDALRADPLMVAALGEDVVERYVAVKRAEMELLESIPESRRKEWIMERY